MEAVSTFSKKKKKSQLKKSSAIIANHDPTSEK